MKIPSLLACLLTLSAASVSAQTYNIDPSHTFPSFEADHAGMSTFRGKFNKSSGKVTLDRKAKTGSLEIAIDPASIDFGHAKLNEHVKSPDMFNVEKFPTITYIGKSIKFDGDKPASVDGDLTMLGITKPITLTISKFKCAINPRLKREVCGADASAEFKKTDFGLTYGGAAFSPEIKLAIQVEAIAAE